MATGQTLNRFTPQGNQPPAASYATPDVRNSICVLDFDAAADEAAVFVDVLPRNYGGGGLTVYLHWAASSATSGTCRWGVQFERGDTDMDADSFATAQAATGAANGTSGIVTTTTITMSSGANMDSLAAGEAFRLRITRDANNGSDTMTGDAQLVAVEIRET